MKTRFSIYKLLFIKTGFIKLLSKLRVSQRESNLTYIFKLKERNKKNMNILFKANLALLLSLILSSIKLNYKLKNLLFLFQFLSENMCIHLSFIIIFIPIDLNIYINVYIFIYIFHY